MGEDRREFRGQEVSGRKDKADRDDNAVTFKDAAADSDIEWEDYLEQIGYTEDELEETVTEYAETKVFQEMIVYYIAEQEGIEVTDDEYEEYMSNMLTESGLDRRYL